MLSSISRRRLFSYFPTEILSRDFPLLARVYRPLFPCKNGTHTLKNLRPERAGKKEFRLLSGRELIKAFEAPILEAPLVAGAS